MGRVIHPSVGISLPAANTSLRDDGVVFVFVLRLAATLNFFNK